jgi:hypothetical protein
MKNVLFSLVFCFCTLAGFTQTHNAHVSLEGLDYTSHKSSKIELSDLLKVDSLVIWQGDDDTSNYEITSAQFIFAPWKGEARLVRITSPKFSQSIKTVINTWAKPGDRLIFDRIRVNRNGVSLTFLPLLVQIVENDTFIRPVELLSKIAFAEDSVASDDFVFEGSIISQKVTTSSQSGSELTKYDTFYFNHILVKGKLNGEFRYYDKIGNVVSKSRYKDSILVYKEYYFTELEPNRIKSTLEFVEGIYQAKHYNEDGYLIAEGNVALENRVPFLLRMQPKGFENSPFDSLNVLTEFPADGRWKICNNEGVVTSEFILVAGLSSFQSTKRNGYYPKKKVIKEKKRIFQRKKAAPRKYKSLGNPDF